MTRNELKNLWSSIKRNENENDYKVIIVEVNKNPYWPGYGIVQVLSDTKDGYSSFKTHQENPMEFALNRKEYKSGSHQLIIK